MLTTQTIFDRYQEVRARFPQVSARKKSLEIRSLLDIADQVDAFVFDAFGVLNVGETMIPGADIRLDQLRERGCAIRILTNAASYDRSGTIAKFKRLGLRLEDDEIITSREAALRNLDQGHWGVIASDTDPLSDLPDTVTRFPVMPGNTRQHGHTNQDMSAALLLFECDVSQMMVAVMVVVPRVGY